jgi:hypothetical protein
MQALERRLHNLECRKGREATVQVPVCCQSVKGRLHFRFERFEPTELLVFAWPQAG